MSVFLDLSDSLLREGADLLGTSLAAHVLAYVLPRQRPEGGFCAPGGGAADLYYTDFGVRLLWLLRAEAAPLQRAAEWAGQQSPRTWVDLFNLYNVQRLAAGENVAAAAAMPAVMPPAEGAYDLFLQRLVADIRGQDSPTPLQAILRLQRGDGGFAESPQGRESQTNATAAALSILWQEPGQQERLDRGCDYLAARQAPATAQAGAGAERGGGFAARAGVPPDLLSTFSALFALSMLGRLESRPIDLAAAAVFVRSCARGDGGFAAGGSPSLDSDIEYTWYGVATACLLRRLVQP